MWLKIKELGFRRCWSLFPSKGLKNWYHFVELQPFVGCSSQTRVPELFALRLSAFQTVVGFPLDQQFGNIPAMLGEFCWGGTCR